MSDSDPPAQPATGLCRIAAVSGVAIGALLLAGAWGHFAAIWDRLGDPDASRLSLLAPGIFLTVAGVINGALCVSIWAARRWAHWLALAANLFATGYFALLLSRGIPDHPIGLFLAVVAGHTLVLGAIAAGLTWPHEPAADP